MLLFLVGEARWQRQNSEWKLRKSRGVANIQGQKEKKDKEPLQMQILNSPLVETYSALYTLIANT